MRVSTPLKRSPLPLREGTTGGDYGRGLRGGGLNYYPNC